MGNKEKEAHKQIGTGAGTSIQLILERPDVAAGQQLTGTVVLKLENVYSKLALEEIVLNLVGFERFSFVR